MCYNPFLLKGKTILVTGASSGIGRATAIECSKMGATLIITGRNKIRLNEVFLSLDINDKPHQQILADLTKEDELIQLVRDIAIIDGCVNNAGAGITKPVQFYKASDIEKIYNINVVAPMLLTKELIRQKKMKNPSSMVFTASISGISNIEPGNGIYGATKSAINGYMKFAAKELAIKGIRCNSVNPGMVETPLINQGTFSQDDKQRDIAKYPLRRYGKPEDIAFAIIYLLSDASAWMTGSEIKIDGGRTLN